MHRYAADLRDDDRRGRGAGGVSVARAPVGVAGTTTARSTRPASRGCSAPGWPGSRSTTRTTHPAGAGAAARDRRRLDLVVTGSSDYHGTGKVDHDLGCNTTAPDQLDRLLDLAARAAEPPVGAASTPRRDSARDERASSTSAC